jgi:uncharacterized membrane protein
MKHLATYLTIMVVFLALDMVWLLGIAKTFYRTQLGGLMTDKVDMVAAMAFYMLFGLGLMMFVVLPHVMTGTWMTAALWGAFFGLVCYATYDLTNLATLKGWPFALAMVDMVWGGILSGLTAAISVAISKAFWPL